MILITAVGEDRPGMAHALAQSLAQLGCNIEDTTMTRLSGEFAMILVVSPPAEIGAESLSDQLASLQKTHGLFLNCKSFEAPRAMQSAAHSRWVISVYGPEKSGLLARITGVLAGCGVNITDVQTRVASGGALYVMVFETEVPATLDTEVLRETLADAAREIGVDVSLHPLEEEVL